jgi:tRNA(Ile)-lysidine synthase
VRASNFEDMYKQDKRHHEHVFDFEEAHDEQRHEHDFDFDFDFEELSQQDEQHHENKISCAIKNLNETHPAIKKRVIRVAIERARGDLRDVTSAHIAAVLELTQAQSGREIHLPGVVVSKEYDKIIFRRSGATNKTTIENFRLKISDSPPNFEETRCTKAFSYDKITEKIVLRTRRDGDKISFRRGDGSFFSKKLQDFFTDKKIPKSERENIPLVAHGSDILWIAAEKNYFNAKFEATDDEKKIFVTITETQ